MIKLFASFLFGLALVSSCGTTSRPPAASPVAKDKPNASPAEKERMFQIQRSDFLKNWDAKNPRFAVLFSGTQGMGKTTVARKIEEELHAVRLSSNVVRSLLMDQGIEVTAENVHDYFLFALEKILKESTNQFVVLDTSMDSAWSKAKELKERIETAFAPSQQYWVRLEVHPEDVVNNLRERNDYVLLRDHMVAKYFPAWEAFGKSRTFDFVLKGNVPFSSQMPDLVTSIEKKLKLVN